MDSEKDKIRIDIKAIGASIGRRAMHGKPNVGKNPKDGDGDGFIVNLDTGLDNVPFNRVRQIDGSGSDNNPMIAGRPVRNSRLVELYQSQGGGKEPKPAERENKPFNLLPKPTKKNPDNRFDDAESDEILKQLKKDRAFAKKLNKYLRGDAPINSLPGGFQRGNGQTEEAHRKMLHNTYQNLLKNQKDMIDSLKRRGYEDVEKAITEFGRSQRKQKSFSPADMISQDDGKMRIEFRDDEDAELEPRQRIMYEFFELIAKKMGKWEQDSGPDGAHYMEEHPFGDKGLKCINCSFFQGGNRCEVVVGEIKPEAICKLWVIRKDLIEE